MSKRTTKIIVSCLLSIPLAFLLTSNALAQTIPTRTPTPSITPPPTATSEGGGGGGTPVPTSTTGAGGNTATPIATSTDDVVVTIAPTPEDGFYPTASACGSQPTLQALSTTNVRNGPSLDYNVIGTLVFLEARPVVGRAQFTDWWQIRLFDGTVGWIANTVVTVQGYTGLVPIITAPPLPNGSTPTPGALWNPTPNPSCTPLPTATATLTPTPSVTPDPNSSPTNTATSLPEAVVGTATLAPAGNGGSEVAILDESIEPTTTLPALPTAIAENGVSPTAEGETTTIAATPASVPTNGEPASDPAGSMAWVPFAGIGLVVVGVGVFVSRRR